MNLRTSAATTCAVLVLAAAAQVFAAPPSSPTPGTYNGLFRESTTNRHETSGFISAKVTPSGGVSGYLILAGTRHGFSGRWPTNGSNPSISITRRGTNALTLALTVADADALDGSVTDGIWSSDLVADRLVWLKTLRPALAHAGAYTASIDRSVGSNRPDGFGYGTISVDLAGAVKLAGVLGDGTKFTQKTSISAQGYWPLYVAAYGRNGSIAAWMPLSNSLPTDATVLWHKGTIPNSPRYPNGFTLTTPMHVSPYVPPSPGQRVININHGLVNLEGGSLQSAVVNELSLGTNNKITNLGAYQLTMTIKLPTGLLSGSLLLDGARQKFSGVVIQATDLGVGHFLSPQLSGAMVMSGDAE